MDEVLKRPGPGVEKAPLASSLASSTPPCEAASISITSMLPGPEGASATQESQTPHGSGVGPLVRQFSERARILALEVLPHPRGPLNRYAWLIRPVRSACWSGPVTWSCPFTSANVAGRYLRYRARLAGVVPSRS